VINEIIASTWPDLFAVQVDESNLTSATEITYSLPADCKRILDIRYDTLGSPRYWEGIGSWRLDLRANTTSYPTGVAVDISHVTYPGRTLKVTYAAEPSPLVDGSDDFAATSGLPDSTSDLICLGAAARLVVSAELARTQMFSVEHASRVDAQPAGAATAASRYLQQLYQVRLEAERNRLAARYPIRVQRTWR